MDGYAGAGRNHAGQYVLLVCRGCEMFELHNGQGFRRSNRGARAIIRRSIQVMPLAGRAARGDDDRHRARVDP